MRYLIIIALFGVSLAIFAIYSPQPENVRFGIIADTQYSDEEARGNRFYRDSVKKLDACVDEFNKENVEFTINVGDLVDKATKKNFDTVLLSLRKLRNKCYNTTGNHDYGDMMDNKSLYSQLGMPDAYYSFLHKGWRFIMLNTNEVASYSHIEGTPLEKELSQMKEKIRETGRKNGGSYNGGVSERQLEWLRKELDTAQKKGEQVIVVSHHPLYAASGFTALNDEEIIEVLSSFPCVKAGISGHHHAGDFGVYKGIPFVTTEGMVETEKESAYALVEITQGKILIKGRGRTKSYTLPIRSE